MLILQRRDANISMAQLKNSSTQHIGFCKSFDVSGLGKVGHHDCGKLVSFEKRLREELKSRFNLAASRSRRQYDVIAIKTRLLM